MISCNSTRGMRPGLLLYVYDPADPQPQFGDRKALVEIIGVESPSVARARIRRDSVRSPILGGDGVASSLWTPGQTADVMIVGYVQLDRDGQPDLDTVRSLVEKAGGRVVDAVTPTTAMVVDAGKPRPIAGNDAKVPGWSPKDESLRDREIKTARQLGIRVVALDSLLDMLGVDRQDIETGSLPARLQGGRPTLAP
jgi:hypothetical protein